MTLTAYQIADVKQTLREILIAKPKDSTQYKKDKKRSIINELTNQEVNGLVDEIIRIKELNHG